jgi:hypothetical protein
MKKFLMMLVVFFGFASLAAAQEFSVKAGIAYNF